MPTSLGDDLESLASDSDKFAIPGRGTGEPRIRFFSRCERLGNGHVLGGGGVELAKELAVIFQLLVFTDVKQRHGSNADRLVFRRALWVFLVDGAQCVQYGVNVEF
ncbi:hypothetical protein ACN28S_58455 [Cystobacter fuscus]